jgi:hypothetical protein
LATPEFASPGAGDRALGAAFQIVDCRSQILNFNLNLK